MWSKAPVLLHVKINDERNKTAQVKILPKNKRDILWLVTSGIAESVKKSPETYEISIHGF